MRVPATAFWAWHLGFLVVAALVLLVILALYVALMGTPKGAQTAANRG